MNLAVIITLSVILLLLIFLVILLLKLHQKNRKLALAKFSKDLDQNSRTFVLQPITVKDLPMKEDKLPTKGNIYYCNRALIGQYEKPEKVINDKNYNITTDKLINSETKISYHYKIITLGRSKFVPLDTIELLITKNHLYVYHPLEPDVVNINKIKDLTIFWEQNRLLKNKEFYPGVAFKANKENYFLLFQNYQQALTFIICLNSVISLN